MKVRDAMNELNKIKGDIKNLLKKSSECDYGDNIKYENNPNDRMLKNEIYNVLSNLDDVSNKLDYLHKPILFEGYLKKNTNDRYELNGIEFTCGNVIEVLIYDDDFYDGKECWVRSRIEHNGKDYYVISSADEKLDSLKVRVRG